mgnify:CR=1 FL=1
MCVCICVLKQKRFENSEFYETETTGIDTTDAGSDFRLDSFVIENNCMEESNSALPTYTEKTTLSTMASVWLPSFSEAEEQVESKFIVLVLCVLCVWLCGCVVLLY